MPTHPWFLSRPWVLGLQKLHFNGRSSLTGRGGGHKFCMQVQAPALLGASASQNKGTPKQNISWVLSSRCTFHRFWIQGAELGAWSSCFPTWDKTNTGQGKVDPARGHCRGIPRLTAAPQVSLLGTGASLLLGNVEIGWLREYSGAN